MIWIFGYGSLMWRPGFPYREKRPATLHGYRRAFCRYSKRHRGTPESPGMVVGLMPGGSCRGMAFLPDPLHLEETLAYLDDREGRDYLRIVMPLEIEGPEGRSFRDGWVYLPDEAHPSHATGVPRKRMVELIATGRGESGTAREYLLALIEELDRLEVPHPELDAVLREVEAYRRRGSHAS